MTTATSRSSSEGDAEKHLILYADDDTDDLELVSDAFRNYAENIELLTFRDGGQILNYIENDPDSVPCLIILDINMPVIDGKKVLTRLRTMENYISVPVVLFTTSTMPLDETFADKYNAAFITKPLRAEQMAEIGDRFLEFCSDDIKAKIRKSA
jgi:CheY-like chemotaxis protein